MSFDDIPEDKEQSYPCSNCGSGSVKLVQKETQGHFPDGTLRPIAYKTWDCDNCTFSELDQGSVE